jgi:hypothetical protein
MKVRLRAVFTLASVVWKSQSGEGDGQQGDRDQTAVVSQVANP